MTVALDVKFSVQPAVTAACNLGQPYIFNVKRY